MRSDSILSPGLLRSNLRRFWPLWLAGLAILAMGFDLPVYTVASEIARSSGSLADRAESLELMWQFMRFEGWLYAFSAALVVALALNDQLFDARTATFVGSLPVRREAVFNTVLVSGLVVLAGLPLVAATLLLPLRVMLGAVFSLGSVLQWLAVTVALAFVFYAFALLACQLSGARPVALLLYFVMNWLVVCLEWAGRVVVSSLMYGVSVGDLALMRFSPALWLAGAATGLLSEFGNLVLWKPIAAYLLVAVLLVLAARALYVRRDLERAGDSVVYTQIRPALKYLAGISMSLLFGFVYRLLSSFDYAEGLPMHTGEVVTLALMLAVGAFLGVLFAEMIMSRSAQVLQKVWKGALALACAAVVLVGACRYDAFGITKRVPDPAQVDKVMVDSTFFSQRGLTLSSAEGVAAACGLHRDLIAYGGAGDRRMSSFTVDVVYQLKDGSRIVRSYPVLSDYFEYRSGNGAVDQGAVLLDCVAEIADSPEGRASRFASVLEADQTKLTVQVDCGLANGTNTTIELPLSERSDFIEHALRPDLMDEEAGSVLSFLADDWGGSYDANLYVLEPLDGNGYTVALNLLLGEDKTPNTVAWLREHHPEIKLREFDLSEKG